MDMSIRSSPLNLSTFPIIKILTVTSDDQSPSGGLPHACLGVLEEKGLAKEETPEHEREWTSTGLAKERTSVWRSWWCVGRPMVIPLCYMCRSNRSSYCLPNCNYSFCLVSTNSTCLMATSARLSNNRSFPPIVSTYHMIDTLERKWRGRNTGLWEKVTMEWTSNGVVEGEHICVEKLLRGGTVNGNIQELVVWVRRVPQ